MAIGTLAAIGLGAAGIGSAISGSSASKAAGKASDATLRAAQENNALQRDIYGQNKNALSPYMERGNTAGSYLNAFLGLPSSASSTASGAFDASSYLAANPDVQQGYYTTADRNRFATPEDYAQYHYQTYGRSENRQLGTTPTPAVMQSDAQNAFGSYIGNSDYGFQLGNGTNALNSGYAGSGTLQSGAAMKALEGYRQNLQAGYRNEYTGQLANQQGVGLGAASALAGVGQSYAASVGANNTTAANATANAALIKGNNNPFANALGMIGGGLLGIGK